MAKLEEILVLIVLSGTFTTFKCSQESHGSYSHYLDKKSYIYRSAIGVPNTGDTEDKNDEDDSPEMQPPEPRSLGEEAAYQGPNRTNYYANLFSFPYSAYAPYQQQEIYKRNAFSSPDLNGPPAPLGLPPPGYQRRYNYGGHNPYIPPSYPSYPSYHQSSPYVTNIHYPPTPVYIAPRTSPAPLYRYSPTPVPYTTPVPVYRFSPSTPGISPTPPLTHHTPGPVYVPPINSHALPLQPIHHRHDPMAHVKSLPTQEPVTPSLIQFRDPRPIPVPTFPPPQQHSLLPTRPPPPPPPQSHHPTTPHSPIAHHSPPPPPPPPPTQSHHHTTHHSPPPPTPPPPPPPLQQQSFLPQHHDNHVDAPSPILLRNPGLLPKLTRFGNPQSPQPPHNQQPGPQTGFPQGSPVRASPPPLTSPESIFLPQKPNHLSGSFREVERPPRKRSRALEKLLDVAGDTWDEDVDIQTNLLTNSKVANFICPSREGYFPDTTSCKSYFQCDHGVAIKQSCQTGLVWNMLIEQCDWKPNVNCDQNSSFRHFTY